MSRRRAPAIFKVPVSAISSFEFPVLENDIPAASATDAVEDDFPVIQDDIPAPAPAAGDVPQLD